MAVSNPVNEKAAMQATSNVESAYSSVDYLIAASRDTVECVLVLEMRLASVAVLAERFGARYLDKATTELQSAQDALRLADSRRRNALGAAGLELGLGERAGLDEIAEASREPLRSCLLDTRSEFSMARDRIKILKAKAEDTLGRRITLVADALRAPGDSSDSIYGRPRYARPTLVSNLL